MADQNGGSKCRKCLNLMCHEIKDNGEIVCPPFDVEELREEDKPFYESFFAQPYPAKRSLITREMNVAFLFNVVILISRVVPPESWDNRFQKRLNLELQKYIEKREIRCRLFEKEEDDNLSCESLLERPDPAKNTVIPWHTDPMLYTDLREHVKLFYESFFGQPNPVKMPLITGQMDPAFNLNSGQFQCRGCKVHEKVDSLCEEDNLSCESLVERPDPAKSPLTPWHMNPTLSADLFRTLVLDNEEEAQQDAPLELRSFLCPDGENDEEKSKQLANKQRKNRSSRCTDKFIFRNVSSTQHHGKKPSSRTVKGVMRGQSLR